MSIKQIKDEMARSSDPDYSQTCGMVHKKLIAKMKIKCFEMGITQSEAIEQAIALWVAKPEDDREAITNDG